MPVAASAADADSSLYATPLELRFERRCRVGGTLRPGMTTQEEPETIRDQLTSEEADYAILDLGDEKALAAHLPPG